MSAVVLGGLRMRKLRAALTALAIVLGVAMVSGTYVLMDTTTHAFDSLFTTAYAKADAVVAGKSPIGGNGSNAPPVPASLVARIRALPEVQAAQGYIEARGAQLRNAKGGSITGPGTPLSLGAPAHPTAFTELQLVAGHRPSGPGEIALDPQTASTNNLHVGSIVGVVTRHPLQRFKVVGLVKFGGVSSLGPIQLLVFDLPVAQRLFDQQGHYDEIYVAARPRVSAQQLVGTIRPLLPADTQVRTRAQEVQSASHDVDQAFSIVRDVLLAFAGIALFVGSFVIFNTLSVTVAQRTREFATLRTLGASRRQILQSVVFEALVIGVLAAVVGLGAGLGIAKGLESLFSSMGMKLPSAGTVLATRTVIVSLGAGVAVTLVASIAPAVRATRVPPIAAVREGAILPPGRFAPGRRWLLASVSLAGACVLGMGLFAGGLSTSARLLMLGGGAAGMFVAVAFVARWLVAPLAGVIGRPFERIAGATGMLARENSVRNPARTAVTAGALTVGVALVAFVAVLGAGLRATINDSVRQQLKTDYVISAKVGSLPPAVGNELQGVPGITSTSVREGQVRAFGATALIEGIDPSTIARFYRLTWASGSSAAALDELGQSGAIVSNTFASDHHLAIGSRVPVTTASGTHLELTIRGIDKPPVFGSMIGDVAISTQLFDRSFIDPSDAGVLVDSGGASATAARTLKQALAGFPNAQVQTVSAFVKSIQTSIGSLLNLFYILLALSVIVSLFGIVNTLVLSIVERTREIGTLRAMGMTRRQVKSMIRIESEITALIGALIGIVVGVALAGLATLALSSWSLTFTVPGPTIGLLLVVALLAGRGAARFPARRAARLDPLRALQYE